MWSFSSGIAGRNRKLVGLHVRRRWSSSPSSLSSSSPSATRRNRSHWLPRRIILMRHGESVGNVDETSYSTTPDWKIELTDLGLQQASEAGKEIRQLCNGGSLYAYVSPYKRTMQTWQQIKKELEEGDGESGSSVQIVGTRQEPRIAEQQFGNFQNPDKVQIAKEERISFGRFFFRFPNGEAGLDVYNRATSFLATMTRDLNQYREMNDFPMDDFNVLIVTHGLCLRLIIMRYFQLTVEEFEESYNAENAKLYIMNRTVVEGDKDNFEGDIGADCNTMVREFFRLDDQSRDALNLKGDVSNEKPIFRREGYEF